MRTLRTCFGFSERRRVKVETRLETARRCRFPASLASSWTYPAGRPFAFAVAVVLDVLWPVVSNHQPVVAFVVVASIIRHRIELFPVSVAMGGVPADASKADSVTTKREARCLNPTMYYAQDVTGGCENRCSFQLPYSEAQPAMSSCLHIYTPRTLVCAYA